VGGGIKSGAGDWARRNGHWTRRGARLGSVDSRATGPGAGRLAQADGLRLEEQDSAKSRGTWLGEETVIQGLVDWTLYSKGKGEEEERKTGQDTLAELVNLWNILG
jgi:hypothetical protein